MVCLCKHHVLFCKCKCVTDAQQIGCMLAVGVGPGSAWAHFLTADLQVASTLKSSCMQPSRRQQVSSWAPVSLHLCARLSSRSVVCCGRNMQHCSTLCSPRPNFLQDSVQHNASLHHESKAYGGAVYVFTYTLSQEVSTLPAAALKTLHQLMTLYKSVCLADYDQKLSGWCNKDVF